MITNYFCTAGKTVRPNFRVFLDFNIYGTFLVTKWTTNLHLQILGYPNPLLPIPLTTWKQLWLINCNEYFLVKSIWRNWPAKMGNWRKYSTSGLPSGGARGSNQSKTNQRSHKWNKIYHWYLMPTEERSFKWKFVRNFRPGGKSCQKPIWVDWHLTLNQLWLKILS